MKTAQQILEANGYTLYVDENVLASAPVRKVQPVTVFTIGKYVICAELEKEYAARGLSPADLGSIAALKEKPDYLASQWKDSTGNFCCVAFYRWLGERNVRVGRSDDGWGDRWSFAGVPLVSSDSELNSSEKPLDTLPLELVVNGIKYRRV